MLDLDIPAFKDCIAEGGSSCLLGAGYGDEKVFCAPSAMTDPEAFSQLIPQLLYRQSQVVSGHHSIN